ncbi:MAG: IS91 family transposase, partial [Flavobacteriales bacterium]
MRTRFEVGTILRQNKKCIENSNINTWKKRTLFALSRCRTPEMGGHIDKCNHKSCGRLHLSYNSCRNRHCPKCGGHQRELWMQKRQEELLPIGYFHVVFTIPSELNPLALEQPTLIYNILFKTAWSVIKDFGDNPKYLGATPGMISILHSWGQNLSLHPHLHCIVPSGGITKNGKWKRGKKKDNFLFPVKEMSKVYRARFVAELRKNGIKNQP